MGNIAADGFLRDGSCRRVQCKISPRLTSQWVILDRKSSTYVLVLGPLLIR